MEVERSVSISRHDKYEIAITCKFIAQKTKSKCQGFLEKWNRRQFASSLEGLLESRSWNQSYWRKAKTIRSDNAVNWARRLKERLEDWWTRWKNCHLWKWKEAKLTITNQYLTDRNYSEGWEAADGIQAWIIDADNQWWREGEQGLKALSEDYEAGRRFVGESESYWQVIEWVVSSDGRNQGMEDVK